MNYLFNSAERDGTVLALVQNNTPLEPLFGTRQARYDATRINWLGTPELRSRHGAALAHGVGKLGCRPARARNPGRSFGRQFDAGLLRTASQRTLGTRMKLVNGYPRQNDALLAMERGELDGYPSVFESALTSTRPTRLADKLAKAMVQYGPERLPQLADVPFAPDLIAREDDKLLVQAAFALALGRPLAMPPDVPPDRVAAIRSALADTFRDPEFRAEGERIGLGVNAPRTGEELKELIVRACQTPARIGEQLQKLNNP
jgi:hypothetical protein